MGKIAQQIITASGSWTAPAGVASINVKAEYAFLEPEFVNSTFLLSQQNSLFACGLNTTGRLGVGDNANKSTLTPIANTTYIKICSSYNTADTNYAIASSGVSYAWGANANGQIGDGTVVPKSVPTIVSGGLLFDVIRSSGLTAAGVTKNGNWYSWGLNNLGQLGVLDIAPRSVPTLVQGAVSFQDVVVGRDAVCALSSAGQVWCVGSNAVGQLGDGTTTTRSSPAVVAGAITFKALYGGYLNTTDESFYAIATNGDTYAWGDNDSGQLGVGDLLNKSSPTLIPGGYQFVKIWDTIENSTYGITADGTLYAWGSNQYGQLGTNEDPATIPRKSSPTLVVGGLKFVYFSPGSLGQNAYGITADGSLYAWGRNQGGQLGQGNITSLSSPALVLGTSGLGFRRVAVIGNSVLAYTTSGDIYGWGANVSGECGLGDTAARSSPVLLAGAIFPQIVTPSEAPFPSTVNITVVPGTTYSVVFSSQYSTFNGIQVGYGDIERLIITYEQ